MKKRNIIALFFFGFVAFVSSQTLSIPPELSIPFSFDNPPGPQFSDSEKEAQLTSGVAIKDKIIAAYNSGAISFTIPPGDYRFKQNAFGYRYIIMFENWLRTADNPFTIYAKGVTFWMELVPLPTGNRGIGFLNCSNIILDGLTIDSDPTNNIEGRITNIDYPNNRIEIEVSPGSRYVSGVVYDDTFEFRAMFYKSDGQHMPSMYSINSNSGTRASWIHSLTDGTSPGRLWVTFRTDFLRTAMQDSNFIKSYGKQGVLEVGDGMGVLYGSASAIMLDRCKQMTIKNFSSYIAKGAFYESYGYGDHKWINCKFMPRPGSNRLQGGDGSMTEALLHGSTYDGFVMKTTTDDMFNFYGVWGKIKSFGVDGKSVTLTESFPQIPHTAKVIAYDNITWDTLYTLSIVSKNGANLIFNESITASPNMILRFPEYECANWTVRNSFLINGCQRTLMQSGQGIFENNIIQNHGSEIRIQSSFNSRGGAMPGNVKMRNNVFIDATTHPTGATLLVTLPRGDKKYIENVSITDNIFVNSGGPSMLVSHAKNIEINNNIMINPLFHTIIATPDKVTTYQPIVIKTTDGAKVAGNVLVEQKDFSQVNPITNSRILNIAADVTYVSDIDNIQYKDTSNSLSVATRKLVESWKYQPFEIVNKIKSMLGRADTTNVVLPNKYSEKTANIILITGQSNAAGIAKISDVFQPNFNALDSVKYACAGDSNLSLSGGEIMTLKEYLNSVQKHHGLELGLGENLQSLSGMSDIFIIKYAWGGSWIDLWQKTSSTIFEGKSNLYNNAISFLNTKVKEIETHGYSKFNFKGLIWFQGESDGITTARANIYGDKLNAVMSNFMIDVADTFNIKPSEVPIYLVQPASYIDKSKYELPEDEAKVTNALSNFAKLNQNARFIPTSDLSGYVDGIHFNTASQLEIGLRITNSIQSFINNSASTYFVRPEGDNSSWTQLAGINPKQIITSNAPEILGNNTYYFSKGVYIMSGITLASGKIYGGFKGDESTIDLGDRELSDKDGNGIIEPWEFTNETVINGTAPFVGTGTLTNRLLTVTGGEVNGVTLQDHYFNDGSSSGTIILGAVSSAPTTTLDVSSNAGRMINCTVKKIKALKGPVMLTNKYSLIDGCLIEECVSTSTSGTAAVYMNLLGGKVSNSVLRNNYNSGSLGGAIFANSLASSDMNAIVENCVLYNNTAKFGGAIRGEARTDKRGIQIVNCTAANNQSTTLTVASVDLISGGLIVNSIVLDDTENEIRANTSNHYVSNNTFGTFGLGLGVTAYPNTDMISDKTIGDFGFTSPTTFQGAMITGDVNFDQTKYDAIRTANFKINQTNSVGLSMVGLKVMPSSYLVGGTGTSVTLTATIPTKDIDGVSRPISNQGNVSLGAYQYNNLTDLKLKTEHSVSVFSTNDGVRIKDAEGKVAHFYWMSGQFIKSTSISSNNFQIPLQTGFYIVAVGTYRSKCFVK